MFGGHTITSTLNCYQFWGLIYCLLKMLSIWAFMRVANVGQKWMNAKEMPILKNSKDNYQHTSSKTSFSACFNSAERLVNMYYWNKATWIRAHVLIADCYSAREMLLLTIVWDSNWGWICPSVLQEESAVTLEDWADREF